MLTSVLPRRLSTRSSLLGIALVVLIPNLLWGDSIFIDGVEVTGVIVREGSDLYYVQDPADGSISRVPRSDDKPVQVVKSDAEERAALTAAWNLARGRTNEPKLPLSVQDGPLPQRALPTQTSQDTTRLAAATSSHGRRLRGNGSTASSRTRTPVASPYVEVVANGRRVTVNLRDIPLRDALKAILRSNNLDYAVKKGYIFVSTPDRVRSQSFSDIETLVYNMKNIPGETLPKIVVRSPQSGFGFGGGNAGGFGGGAQGGGAFGGGAQGGGAFGGGAQGGGAFGGGAQGAGGFGGGGGGAGGFGGGQAFSNIFQLFSTIDDRLVGETPNPISRMMGAR